MGALPKKKCYSCGELKELSMYRNRAVSKDEVYKTRIREDVYEAVKKWEV